MIEQKHTQHDFNVVCLNVIIRNNISSMRLFHLFNISIHVDVVSIGIGDGGNEIGMGVASHVYPRMQELHPSLPLHPCTTVTTHLLLASTSNWGTFSSIFININKYARILT